MLRRYEKKIKPIKVAAIMKKPRLTRHHIVVTLTLFWALTFVHMVRAATLSEFMGGYDQSLLRWAAASCLMGGSLRTIFSLESDKRAVRDIASTAMWDALKSLLAGMTAFVVIQAIRSAGVTVPNEIRFLAVVAAGWARLAAFDYIMNTGREWLDARKAQIVSKPLDTKDTS